MLFSKYGVNLTVGKQTNKQTKTKDNLVLSTVSLFLMYFCT